LALSGLRQDKIGRPPIYPVYAWIKSEDHRFILSMPG
jgi:hypothetical protein